MPMTATLRPLLGDPRHVGRRERKADLLRRDLFGQPVHGVELGDRLLDRPSCRSPSGRAADPLPDVDDQERDVEAALLHLRQVDLRGQALRVVAGGA